MDNSRKDDNERDLRRQRVPSNHSLELEDSGLPSLKPPSRRKSSRRGSSPHDATKVDDSLDELSIPLREKFNAARNTARFSLVQKSDDLSSPIHPHRRRKNYQDAYLKSSLKPSGSFERRLSAEAAKVNPKVTFKEGTAIPEKYARHESSRGKSKRKGSSPNPADDGSTSSSEKSVKLPLPPWLFKIQSHDTKEKSLLDQKMKGDNYSMKALTGTDFDVDDGSPDERGMEEGVITAEATAVRPTTRVSKSKVPAGGRAPGAYEVNRRAPGYLPAWFRRPPPRTPPQEFTDDDDDDQDLSTLEDDVSEIQLPFRWGLCIGLASLVVLLVVAGLVVGIILTATSEKNSHREPEVPDDVQPPEPQAACDFTDIKQPDPYLQCACTDKIGILSQTTKDQYAHLKKGFIPTILPDFNFPIDSCEPHNMALVWLAVDSQSGSDDWTVLRNRYVLVVLYALWEGDNWKENNLWLTAESECDWFGISCIQDAVTEVILPENNIHGLLPTELGMLTSLKVIDFSNNFLEGSLPEELYEATDLEQILLWTNRLEGTISENIGSMTNLNVLGMDENLFTGHLPESMASLKKLRWVLLEGNDFDGPLFDLVLQWPKLESLEARSNSFTGTIPTEFGTLSKLRILDLSSNYIQGTFPTELGIMSSMEYFAFDGHQMSGTIPTELGNWQKVAHLAIMTGKLDGSIPTELGNLALLEDVTLASNDLTGLIPSEFGRCQALLFLDLGRNKLSSHVPSEIGLLTNLKRFKIDGITKLKGTVPEEVCALREGSLDTFWIPCRSRLQCQPESCCTPICS